MFQPKTLNHQEQQLLVACDQGDFQTVQNLFHHHNPHRHPIHTIFSQATLTQSFQLLLLHRNLDLLPLFLTPHSLISQSDLDEFFTQQVLLGKYPELIHFLQEYCSTRLLAELNRYQVKCRYESYLIQPSELEQIANWQKFLFKRQHWMKSRSKVLLLQLQINNFFFDAGFCNWRYLTALMLQLIPLQHFPTVRNILSYSSSTSSVSPSSLASTPASEDLTLFYKIVPSQSTINQVFGLIIRKGNFQLAEMMTASLNHPNQRLCVTQQGIDDAVRTCVKETNFFALEWFYNNIVGVRPSQEVTEESYHELCVYEKKISAPERLNRWNLYRHFFASQQRRLHKHNTEQREAVAEFLRMLVLYVRPEIIEQTNQELQRIEERQQRIANARYRLGHSLYNDIHSYSNVRVDEDGNGNVAPNQIVEDAMDVVGEEGPDDDGMNEFPQNPEQPNNAPVPVAAVPNVNPASVHQRRSLNAVIHQHLKDRVGADLPYTQDLVTSELTRLVEIHLPPDKHDEAFRRLGDMLNRESIENFGVTLAFLRLFHPEQMGVWIVGFLGESIDVHSCTPGAMERIATGLRGIGDEQLDRLFSHAEGPQLFRIFLGTFNIFDSNPSTQQRNLTRLVELLLERGIHPLSGLNDIRDVLTVHIQSMKDEFGIASNQMQGDCSSLIEVILDVYESDVLPALREKYLSTQPQSISTESCVPQEK